MDRRYAVLGLCLSMIVAALSGCGGHAGGHGEAPPTVVKFIETQAQKVTDYVYVTGRMDAEESVDVRARVTGYLVGINFKPGEEITESSPLFPSNNKEKPQTPLFKIDPRPYQAVLDQANSQVALSEARLQLAKADLARAKKVAETPGAISQQELDTFSANASQAAAALEAAKAARESAQLNVQFTDINAPIGGVVGRNLITVGNLVTQDTTLLTTIVSQDPMFAYFDVDERTMLDVQRLIREGKIASTRDSDVPVELGLGNEGNSFPHSGVIDFVNNTVDPSTGTIQVRGVFPNPKLKGDSRLFTPGLFVRVRLPIGKEHEAIVVPQAAVVSDQGQKFLYVINSESVIEYRPITVGAVQSNGLQVVVPTTIVRTKEGIRVAATGETGEPSIAVGEKVVLSGLQRIRPGLKVVAKPASDSE